MIADHRGQSVSALDPWASGTIVAGGSRNGGAGGGGYHGTHTTLWAKFEISIYDVPPGTSSSFGLYHF